MAFEASITAITVASTQPALNPLSTQSPVMTRLSKPVSPGLIRNLVLPGTDMTYRSEGSMFPRQNCSSNLSKPFLLFEAHSKSQLIPLLEDLRLGIR